MAPAQWLFDSSGTRCREAAIEGTDLVAFNGVKSESATKLVKYLGYVRVGVALDQIDVRFDPAIVAPAALRAAIDHVRTFAQGSIVFHNPADGTQRSFATSDTMSSAAGQILIARSQSSSYQREPMPLAQSSFADRWVEALAICCNADLSPDEACSRLDPLFGGHFLLAELDAHNDYCIELLGPWLAKRSSGLVRGASIRASYDRGFGEWSAARFAELTGTDQPVVDRIDALVAFPTRATQRYHYERLAVPHFTGGRHRLLIGVQRPVVTAVGE